MEKIYKLAQGLMKRFPKGVEPYQMATRLAEECGEVASEICHWEDSRGRFNICPVRDDIKRCGKDDKKDI